MQAQFFNHLKQQLPSHLTLVDEVADLLNISNDSAYRRIRGDKPLSFDEIQKLAVRFHVSLDQFLHLQGNTITFTGNYINRAQFNFNSYLQSIVNQLLFFNAAQKKELFYLGKDFPIFHHFLFPELAAFKCYFWGRYNLNYQEYNRGQFLIQDFLPVFEGIGRKISDSYINIPSTEIWNIDCINTTLRQINFYRESKLFKSHLDLLTVFDCLEKLIDHIEEQAARGWKFPYQNPHVPGAKYQIFVNQFFLGDNMVAVEMDEVKMVFLNHNVINYIQTTDIGFIDYTFETLHTLLRKSSLISEVGEQERENFFDSLRERIYETKKLAL
jgi:BetR domain